MDVPCGCSTRGTRRNVYPLPGNYIVKPGMGIRSDVLSGRLHRDGSLVGNTRIYSDERLDVPFGIAANHSWCSYGLPSGSVDGCFAVYLCLLAVVRRYQPRYQFV